MRKITRADREREWGMSEKACAKWLSGYCDECHADGPDLTVYRVGGDFRAYEDGVADLCAECLRKAFAMTEGEDRVKKLEEALEEALERWESEYLEAGHYQRLKAVLRPR